jgi:hypothetical protein
VDEKVELIRLERGKTAFEAILSYVRSLPALHEDIRELKDRTARIEQQLAQLAQAPGTAARVEQSVVEAIRA